MTDEPFPDLDKGAIAAGVAALKNTAAADPTVQVVAVFYAMFSKSPDCRTLLARIRAQIEALEDERIESLTDEQRMELVDDVRRRNRMQ